MSTLPSYVKIQDNATLVRDTFSKGILNTNINALNEAKMRHQIALNKIGEERRRQQELNTLRKEVDVLKDLVKQLLEKN